MQIKPVNKLTHINKGVKRPIGFGYSREKIFVPVTVSEIPKLGAEAPIALVKQDGGWQCIVLMGVEATQNLFIQANGHFLLEHHPAAIVTYPFSLQFTKEGSAVLCIDEDCGFIVENGYDYTFFDSDGNPSKMVEDVKIYLVNIEKDRQRTLQIFRLFDRFGLIEPWGLKIQTKSGVQTIEGLYTVSEAKLNQLSDADFMELRAAGALTVFYLILISVFNIKHLRRLYEARQRNPEKHHGTPFHLSAERELNFDV